MSDLNSVPFSTLELVVGCHSWWNIIAPVQDACFTNVDKFVTPTSACSCLLHMHAGVYYTCTQVSMTPARRCPWYLHADVYYTCLQVTIAQKVTQIGMQLYKTLARMQVSMTIAIIWQIERRRWRRQEGFSTLLIFYTTISSTAAHNPRHCLYTIKYSMSMTTARRCLWHLHADPHNTHFHDYLIHSEDDDHNDSILSFLYICLSLACRSKLSFCTYLPSSTTDWVSCNKEMADA